MQINWMQREGATMQDVHPALGSMTVRRALNETGEAPWWLLGVAHSAPCLAQGQLPEFSAQASARVSSLPAVSEWKCGDGV